jgi:hypothetical protein
MAQTGGSTSASQNRREQLTRARAISNPQQTNSTAQESSNQLNQNKRPITQNLSTTAERRSKNQATNFANRLATSFGPRRGLDPQAPDFGPRPDLKTLEAQSYEQRRQRDIPESNQPRGTQEVDPTSVDQLRSQLSDLKMKIGKTKKQSAREELEKLKDEQIQRIRRAVKRRAKAAFKRGVIYVVDLIASGIDIGTTGVSIIVDIFIYIFTFGWLNLELFYGKKFRKGKDPFISPLSWDPIPVPVDPNAVILEGIIIAADIAIIIIGFVLFFLGFCILHDYISFMENPLDFATSIVQSPGDSCFGAIITGSF